MFKNNLFNADSTNELIEFLRNNFIKYYKDELDALKKHVFNELDSFNNFCSKSLENNTKNNAIILDKNNIKLNELDNKLNKIDEKISTELQKKINNYYELNDALNNKADINSMHYALQSKASISELDKIRNLCDRILTDMNNKIDFNKFDSYSRDNKKNIDDLKKDVISRASIKETLNMLKNKVDVDDVNKALGLLQDEIDLKADVQNVSYLLINYYIIYNKYVQILIPLKKLKILLFLLYKV